MSRIEVLFMYITYINKDGRSAVKTALLPFLSSVLGI
jgi:hypothetical protein